MPQRLMPWPVVALAAALAALAACGRAATGGESLESAEARLASATTDGPIAGLGAQTAQAASPVCPESAQSPDLLPGVRPEHLTLDYWLARVAEQQGDLEEVLLTAEAIDDHNRAILLHQDEQPLGLFDLLAPVDVVALQTSLDERLAWLTERFEAEAYVERDGRGLSPSELASFGPVSLPESIPIDLRVALEAVPIRCGPRAAGYFTPSLDLRFDRNNCSTAHPQEVIQVLHRWPNSMLLVRTRYTLGWISASAALSPRVPEEWLEVLVAGVDQRLTGAVTVEAADAPSESARLPAGTRLASGSEEGRVVFATASGVYESRPVGRSAIASADRPLTRRAVLEEAFALLGAPYGWGGEGGGRDCSRFLLDLFSTFGLELPRHSAYQAHAGVFSIDIRGLENETERALLIDSAARRGVVLLHFPGHIMLYLGRNAEGAPMAIHAFAEYLEPCPDGSVPEAGTEAAAETLYRVDNITVSDLELGRGTSRRAFIERITHMVVLGPSAGIELAGIAELRAAAPVDIPSHRSCRDSQETAFFQLPLQPNRDERLRVIATTSRDLGPVELTLVDPDGGRHNPEPRRLGGPPWAWDVSIDRPQPGRWRAVLGDGSRVEACWRIYVRREPLATLTAPDWAAERAERLAAEAAMGIPPPRRPAEAISEPAESGAEAPDEPAFPSLGPVWELRRSWGLAVENLYATWVESLFDYPVDEDVTWTSLTELLQDRDRNFLFNYLSQNEDAAFDPDDEDSEDLALFLQPDCADLPYLLRAYYAWKMGLPFSFRRCARGSAGRPPGCMEINHNLMGREYESDVLAFNHFANREVRRAVHSASGRTHPEYEFSDFYPVSLTREALRPGILFADPYGHLLVITEWVPQSIDGYGMLIASDAQPDGTVGRRRFWRGSFLFHPDTTDVGAGFKHFRPVYWYGGRGDEELGELPQMAVLRNENLMETERFPRFDLGQYEGTADDFYETMEAMINPRPLDPVAMQRSLVDALAEAVSRRGTSVANGEEYMAHTRYNTVEMPERYAIFETVGAWEDYSTPSRDMRLLISLDTVVHFPDVVRRSPERFGLTADTVDQGVADLRVELDRALQAATFDYTRSDGSPWSLTLRDVADRAARLEMAYNPNDCVEIRWGAEPGTAEHATCDREAPAEQRERMVSYRPWFEARRRPPR